MKVTAPIDSVQRLVLDHEPLGFRRGFRAPFRAIGYLLTHPRELGLCVAPWLINLLVVLPLAGWLVKELVYDTVLGWLPDGDSVWIVAMDFAAGVFLIPVCVGLVLLLVLLASMVIGAPFHDKVGEAIERRRLAGQPGLIAPPTPFWRGVRHAVFEAAKRVSLGLVGFVLVLILSVIPVLGPPIALAAQVFLAAFFLTWDSFSMPLDRRGIGARAKMHWLLGNRRFTLGFGLPMLVVPCAFFLMPPLAAVAASLVYTDLLLRVDEKSQARQLEGEKPRQA